MSSKKKEINDEKWDKGNEEENRKWKGCISMVVKKRNKNIFDNERDMFNNCLI